MLAASSCQTSNVLHNIISFKKTFPKSILETFHPRTIIMSSLCPAALLLFSQNRQLMKLAKTFLKRSRLGVDKVKHWNLVRIDSDISGEKNYWRLVMALISPSPIPFPLSLWTLDFWTCIWNLD